MSGYSTIIDRITSKIDSPPGVQNPIEFHYAFIKQMTNKQYQVEYPTEKTVDDYIESLLSTVSDALTTECESIQNSMIHHKLLDLLKYNLTLKILITKVDPNYQYINPDFDQILSSIQSNVEIKESVLQDTINGYLFNFLDQEDTVIFKS